MDGERRQRIRHPDRTKALLHDLNLEAPFKVSVQSRGTNKDDDEEEGEKEEKEEEEDGDGAVVTVRFEPAMLDKIGKMRQPPPVPKGANDTTLEGDKDSLVGGKD